MPEENEISCREAGRRGGKKCSETHGREHYCRIGEKGGRTTVEKHGSEHYQRIGSMGGSTTAKRHGPEFFEKIGRKGGQRLRSLVQKAKEIEALETNEQ